MGFELGLFFVACSCFGCYAVVRARRDRTRRLAAWRSVLARRGGTFVERDDTIFFRIGDAKIEVTLRNGFTHVRGIYPVAAGPLFVLYPRRGKLEGLMDVGIYYPRVEARLGRLDEGFLFRSPEPEATQALWSSRSAMNLAELFFKARVVGERGSLCIDLLGVLIDAELLETAIDLVAELANADLFGMAALRALPNAADASRPGGPVRTCLQVGATLVHFRPIAVDGRAATLAWVEVDDGATFEVPLPSVDMSAAVSSFPRTLPSEAIAQLERMGNGTLAGADAWVRFTWTAVERHADRLLAAAQVLAAFDTQPAQAPYR